MIHVNLSLPDDIGHALDARLRDGGYADLADYVRALIETDLDPMPEWQASPELIAAVEEGERSGESSLTVDQIFAEARARFDALR